MAFVASLLVVAGLAVSCGGDGQPLGTITSEGSTFTVTDAEAGQFNVTACEGTECTIERDGVLFSARSILVTLEPEGEVTDAVSLADSALATGCQNGDVFVRDQSQGYGCQSFSVSAEGSDSGSGAALVFAGDCRDCPDDGFHGDLELVVPGNDPVKLN